MSRISRALDWGADHAGDVYFLAMALVAAAAVVLVVLAATGVV